MLFVRKFSPRTAWLVVALICLLSFSLMAWSAVTESAIMDELAHIPAGYGYVHNLDYRLNPEHPPLIKALAMLPVLFLRPNFPTQSPVWTDEINGQWAMGAQFLYTSGNDPSQIIRLARIFPMLITILTAILIYVWSRELMGKWRALIPTALFALSPNILAHGHYVATDVGAAFGIFFATYFFLKFLRAPSRKHLVYAGLAFGVATIAKFSTALLVPYFLIILAAFYLLGVWRDWEAVAQERFRRFYMRGLRYLKSLVLIFAIGYVFVVYPVYFLFTANYPMQKQTADTAYILQSFAGGPTPAGKLCSPMRCLADLDVAMTKNAATRPLAEYMLGVLMVLQRAAGGNTAYFLGQVSSSGSVLYFPIVYMLKEPLPVLIMVLIAIFCAAAAAAKKIRQDKSFKTSVLDYSENNFTQFSMVVFIVLYWIWSMRSALNIGFRHLLPTLPFIYVLTSGVWKKWAAKISFGDLKRGLGFVSAFVRILLGSLFKYVLLAVLVIWFIAETVFAAPYFLSYFNELGGGVWGGYRYATDSNYDWGQDLLRLQSFVNSHPEIDKIAIDYFGGGSPIYYLGDCSPDSHGGVRASANQAATTHKFCAENWWSSRGSPAVQGIHWFAVSVNSLQGSIQPLAPGQQRNPGDEYGWLTALRPPAPGLGNVPESDYRVGTSIFVYKL